MWIDFTKSVEHVVVSGDERQAIWQSVEELGYCPHDCKIMRDLAISG